jgi:pilus assembly protein Flp/PilA
MSRWWIFLRDETGASAPEYGLLVALISVVILSAVKTLGTNLSTKFSSIATSIGSYKDNSLDCPARRAKGQRSKITGLAFY